MDLHGWIAIAILVAAVVLYMRKTLPHEVTSLCIPLALLATGTLTVRDSLSGFGSKAAITIGAMFIVGAALQEAGITTLITRALQRVGGNREAPLVIGVMLVGLFLSSFMSTVAAVALFIPAVMALSRRTGVAPSKLLMPLSFGAVLGCNLFLISSVPNMLIADAASHANVHLGMFSFTRYGLPIVVAGLLFMAFIGRRMLPVHTPEERLSTAHLPEEVAKSYELTKSLYRMRIVPESTVAGRTVAASGVRSGYGLDIIAIVRPRTVGEDVLDPRPDVVLLAGDDLYVEGDDEAAWRLADYETLQYCAAGPKDIERLLGRGVMVAEVALSPRSDAQGQSLRQIDFRNARGLNVLSVWRRGERHTTEIADDPLQFGDVLLVSGPVGRVRELAKSPDWVVFTDLSTSEDLSHAPWALACLLVAVVPAAIAPAHVPLAISALAAALLLVATKTLPLAKAYQSLDWRVLFQIMGVLPLGLALEQHGVAGACADAMQLAALHVGPFAAYALLFMGSAVIGISSSNATAASVFAPVALGLAGSGDLDTAKALIAVSFGASCAYILPIHPWNLVVLGPGGYQPRDFLRVGIPMTLVVTAAAIASFMLIK